MKRIKVSEKKISTGLKVIHLQTGPSSLFEASIHFPVGSSHEPPEQNGLSHLLEHMMFRGSGIYSDSLAFSEKLESICGETNAFTSAESTEYWFQCSVRFASECLELLSFFLTDPKFSQFEIEKRIIIQEIDEDYNESGALIDDFTLAMHAHFGNEGLGLSIGGTHDGLAGITPQHIHDFRLKHYDPHTAILTVQSEHPAEVVFDLCQKHLSNWTSQNELQSVSLPHARAVQLRHAGEETRVAVNQSDNQFSLRLSFALPVDPILKHDPHFCRKIQTFELIERLLNDGTSSRLQASVRETMGLVYTISATFHEYREALTFDIEATVAPEHLLETFEEVARNIRILKNSQATEKELNRSSLRAIFEVEKLEEQHRNYLERLVDAKFQNLEFSDNVLIENFRSITAQDLQAAAREIFQAQNLALVLVGPEAEKWIGKLRTVC